MTTSAHANNHGFEWRTLLGPTYDWPTPIEAANRTAQPKTSSECCELCGGPIADGRPFTTNSAGEAPMHLACLEEQAPVDKASRPVGRIWAHLLHFVRG
jgi:hypothetical protein